MSKSTFKEYLQEDLSDQAMVVAANFLDTQPAKLEPVDPETADKVLNVGKEIDRKEIRTVGGALIIRLFKALGSLFARVEGGISTVKSAMYTTHKD